MERGSSGKIPNIPFVFFTRHADGNYCSLCTFTFKKVLNDSHGVGFVPGHEAVGVVVKAGPNAILNVGDRIAVENHFYCGNCVMCDEDRGDICMKMYQFGYGNGTKHGGCSQWSNLR